MNRRDFLQACIAIGLTPQAALADAPEITHCTDLTPHPIYGHPWQIRWVRHIAGAEYEFAALTNEHPTPENLAHIHRMFEAAYERAKARYA